jgi:hypothetical protein
METSHEEMGRRKSKKIRFFMIGNISKDSVYRHKRDHLPLALIKAKEAQEVLQGDDLWQQMTRLNLKTQKILARAGRTGNQDMELRAVAEICKNHELQGKLLGELGKQKQPAGDRHLHLHGLSVADLTDLAETGQLPDDEPTESKHLVEVKRTH